MEDVKYTLAADTNGVISSLFGVYDDATGLALRGTFIISPEGKLVSATVNFYNVGRNMEELTRVIEANVHCQAIQQKPALPSGLLVKRHLPPTRAWWVMSMKP